MQNRTRLASLALALVSGFGVASTAAPAFADGGPGTHQCIQRKCDPSPCLRRVCTPQPTTATVSPVVVVAPTVRCPDMRPHWKHHRHHRHAR